MPLAVLPGCELAQGEAGSGSGIPCGEEGRSGVTSCGGVNCDAGEWCDALGGFRCEPGCTSDFNCGGDAFCLKSGEAVGRCADCGSLPSDPGGESCVVDAHCEDIAGADFHEICVAGRCRLGCRFDADCGPGFVCAIGNDVCRRR